MNSRWKQYLIYASLIIVGGGLLCILFETVKAKNTGFETKTLWDWMELLIIPGVLAGGALFLNRSERDAEREIANDRQQEIALQSYLDRMGDLLLKEKLRNVRNVEVRNVARIRTLTILRGLDKKRKRLVLIFLQEAGLINKEKPIIDLTDADLRDVNLYGAVLRNVNLQNANLRNANLKYVHLSGANMKFVDLKGAELQGANLRSINLSGTDLKEANLRGANLAGATGF